MAGGIILPTSSGQEGVILDYMKAVQHPGIDHGAEHGMAVANGSISEGNNLLLPISSFAAVISAGMFEGTQIAPLILSQPLAASTLSSVGVAQSTNSSLLQNVHNPETGGGPSTQVTTGQVLNPTTNEQTAFNHTETSSAVNTSTSNSNESTNSTENVTNNEIDNFTIKITHEITNNFNLTENEGGGCCSCCCHNDGGGTTQTPILVDQLSMSPLNNPHQSDNNLNLHNEQFVQDVQHIHILGSDPSNFYVVIALTAATPAVHNNLVALDGGGLTVSTGGVIGGTLGLTPSDGNNQTHYSMPQTGTITPVTQVTSGYTINDSGPNANGLFLVSADNFQTNGNDLNLKYLSGPQDVYINLFVFDKATGTYVGMAWAEQNFEPHGSLNSDPHSVNVNNVQIGVTGGGDTGGTGECCTCCELGSGGISGIGDTAGNLSGLGAFAALLTQFESGHVGDFSFTTGPTTVTHTDTLQQDLAQLSSHLPQGSTITDDGTTTSTNGTDTTTTHNFTIIVPTQDGGTNNFNLALKGNGSCCVTSCDPCQTSGGGGSGGNGGSGDSDLHSHNHTGHTGHFGNGAVGEDNGGPGAPGVGDNLYGIAKAVAEYKTVMGGHESCCCSGQNEGSNGHGHVQGDPDKTGDLLSHSYTGHFGLDAGGENVGGLGAPGVVGGAGYGGVYESGGPGGYTIAQILAAAHDNHCSSGDLNGILQAFLHDVYSAEYGLRLQGFQADLGGILRGGGGSYGYGHSENGCSDAHDTHHSGSWINAIQGEHSSMVAINTNIEAPSHVAAASNCEQSHVDHCDAAAVVDHHHLMSGS